MRNATDMTIRHLEVDEWDVFDRLVDPDLVGFAAFGDAFAEMAADGQYRPEWTWIASRGDDVVARAAWWGGPDDDGPRSLDWFDFTDATAAVHLLRTAPLRAPYSLRLPPGWRDDSDLDHEARRRLDAAERAGYEQVVERHRYAWTPRCGMPDRPGRLAFAAAPDDAEALDLLRRITVGSLDAHTGRVADRDGVDTAAREEFAHLDWLPSPRDWWRVASTPGGTTVGLVVPAANHTDFQIGFVGVVPEHRGHGYAHDLLVEATLLLVAQGAERIVAATDQHNTPMAAAFERAGYPVEQHVIDLTIAT